MATLTKVELTPSTAAPSPDRVWADTEGLDCLWVCVPAWPSPEQANGAAVSGGAVDNDHKVVQLKSLGRDLKQTNDRNISFGFIHTKV